jgi:Carboxypeptidase regulatory-like domain
MKFFRRAEILCVVIAVVLSIALPGLLCAQATISTGSIAGTIVDPKGAVVPGAKVTITSKATGQAFTPSVSDSGDYTSGALTPGEFVVRVEAPGFKTVEKKIVVQVGLVSPGNVNLEIGESTTVVTVEGSGVQVNTDQAIVSGVLTTEQIENLPINGRNFLDLAQLEPGVQIQDGQNFDPTKVGYSSISFGGRFGRTARINVDGVDISDETVGTTTTNIPASALQEFQLSQSSLDLSNDITSSGSVNVVTRSGTNDFHGEAFGYLRDSGTAAALPRPVGQPAPPFQRSQPGGNVGGPVIKDKLFFFADAEHTIQHLFAPLALSDPFTALGTGYNSPFKENDLLGKVDYVATQNLKLFYRFTYFGNYAVSEFQTVGLNPYLNKDYTRTHVVGADWTKGSYTNSFRFEYLKFQNQILDATLASGLPFSTLGASLAVGALNAGPSTLAPQTTPQSDHDYKYDGSKVLRNHSIRYGASINHIQGGGFAKFFSINPLLINSGSALASPTADPTNPLNYTVQTAIIGNGLGFSTEKAAFGYPFGGLGPDNRVGLYIGDSWKVKTNVTVTGGLRWDRDTGRTDSDLNNASFNTVVNSFFPGLGRPVRQPNKNFAPQLGVAWDPFKNGKTAIRAGIGLFYENVIYNSVLFDRPLRIPSGGFLAFPNACVNGQAQAVAFGDGTSHQLASGVCGASIGSAAPAIIAFQKAYQASFPANATLPNPNYLPTLLQSGTQAIPTGFFGPDYQSPRSVQMNIGVQRQLWKGAVISADFVRNVATHYELGIDINHVGDVRYFDKNAAAAAISRTLGFCGATTINQALTLCPNNPQSASQTGYTPRPATISDFAVNGLGTPADAGVSICDAATTGFRCAFGGINPNSPSFPVQEPVGRATYDGLQLKYTQNVANPAPGIKNLSLQVSYSLSSFKDDGGQIGFSTQVAANDQDFVNNALDYANPAKYFGPGSLDRRNQFSVGGVVDVPGNFRIGFVGHFYSALPATLYSVESGSQGEIFRTDFNGSGTLDPTPGNDPLPGTTIGAFGRGVQGVGGLISLLNNYNSNVANQATPAGQLLVQNGLFTLAQLQSVTNFPCSTGTCTSVFGGVAPSIAPPPPGQVGVYGLRAFDFKFSWVHKFKERLTVEPGVSFYNAFNFANFDLPQTLISGILNGQPGSLNGTTYSQQTAQRVGVGTGVFSLGAPRVIEWGLKLTF